MIGKLVVGTNFDKLLRYIETKDGAYRLDSNLAGNNITQLGAEFKASAALRPGMSRCVWHTTLSVSPDEEISDSLWGVIARDYLQQMGFGQRQFVAYKHCDTEHHHIHIVASRINLADGSAVSDSWNWWRSQGAIRTLEKRYNLRQVESSLEKGESSPTTGEVRLARRTGKPIVRQVLQSQIKSALETSETVGELVERLQKQGVSVRFRQEQQRIMGVSFGREGIAFPGCKLGKMFGWPNLERTLEENQERRRSQLRDKLRELYEQTRGNLPLGITPEQVDKAIALLLLKKGRNLEEVKAALSQSERVRDMKAEKPEDIYQQEAHKYINSVVRSAKLLVEREQQLAR